MNFRVALVHKALVSASEVCRKRLPNHPWIPSLDKVACFTNTPNEWIGLRADCVNSITSSWVHLDQEEAQGVLPMLAVKSHESRMTFAHVVERKGPVDSTTPTTCCRSRLVGIAKIGVQIRSRTGDSGSQTGGSRVDAQFVMEESAVEEHQSNGNH